MRRTAPLFRLDPGWLFTVAGLAVMVVSALLPAERDLHDLRQQMAALEVREAWNEQRLAAYDRFMRDLGERDPALIRRLAASQLNLMPEGEQPLLMATSIEHTVSDWIEATVPPPTFAPVAPPDTLLTRLADGSRRLWLMGGGAMVVFLGLVMGFGVSPRPALEVPPEVEAFARSAAEQADADLAEETVEPPTVDAAEALSDSELLAACEDQAAELPFETVDVDHPQATADPVEQEVFEWPEPEPPFEPAGAESGASVDGWAVDGWPVVTTAQGQPSPDAPPVHDQADDSGWLRDHGSD